MAPYLTGVKITKRDKWYLNLSHIFLQIEFNLNIRDMNNTLSVKCDKSMMNSTLKYSILVHMKLQ